MIIDARANLSIFHVGLRLRTNKLAWSWRCGKGEIELSLPCRGAVGWYWRRWRINPHFGPVEPNLFISSWTFRRRCLTEWIDATLSFDIPRKRVVRSYRFHPFWKWERKSISKTSWRSAVTVCGPFEIYSYLNKHPV